MKPFSTVGAAYGFWAVVLEEKRDVTQMIDEEREMPWL